MEQKQQIADRLKQANNILVTVSNNPSVDQLTSCIGLTLAFNKMGKHATAVFSGAVPSTIGFLEPEKTIEANTDSLRDFIISLDKAKADKLRYKVEDKVVKIFITPYRTSISEHDLEFSQGDLNVDVVIALGVHSQNELDQAIVAHGRILHDATVTTINVKPGGDLGSINWLAPGASSLCELATDLINVVDKQLIDSQIATAFLTGVVAETERFSNERTTPDTMNISAQLMAAGANQQLVANKLEESVPPAPAPAPAEPPKEGEKPPEAQASDAPQDIPKHEDGTLEISHAQAPEEKSAEEEKPPENEKPEEEDKPVSSLDELTGPTTASKPPEEKTPEETPQIRIDDQGSLHNVADKDTEEKHTDPTSHMGGSRMILQPPSSQGQPDPSAVPGSEFGGPSVGDGPGAPPAPDPFAQPVASATIAPPPAPFMPPSMTPGPPVPPAPAPSGPPESSTPAPQPFTMDAGLPGSGTVAASPDLSPSLPPPTDDGDVGQARDALSQAFSAQSPDHPEPIQALNAQPLGDPLHSLVPPMGNTPPDLNVPAPADASAPAPALNIPTPVGPPPPGPPPMMPPAPQ